MPKKYEILPAFVTSPQMLDVMSERNKRKLTLICLSSEEDGDSEQEEEDDDDDDDDEDEESSDYSISEDGIDEEEEEVDEKQPDGDDDEDSLCNRVICLLKEGGDLGALNLQGCKSYLCKHGLRVSGTKMVCIQRIKEHWRIRDGNGEVLYPKASFVINCTGDVCRGDIVLFMQKVYKKFDKVTRHGRFLGQRTVAGRVVSDSYGAAKQQHTFTYEVQLCNASSAACMFVVCKIEVLWSKGINKLPPLFPLLVKGRNLYKLKTYRQQWNDEAERRKVLEEKHKRGTEARFVRAMRKTENMQSASGGTKHQKHFHHTRSSQKRKTTEPEKRKCVGLGNVKPRHHRKLNDYRQQTLPSTNLKSNRNAGSGGSRFSLRWKDLHHLNDNKEPTLQSYTHHQSPYPSETEFDQRNVPFHFSGHDISHPSQIGFHQRNVPFHFSGHDISHPSQIGFHQRNVPFHFSGHDMSHTSTMISLPHFKHGSGMSVVPTSQYQGFRHCNDSHHSNPNHGFEFRS
ncbi:zinc finger CCCH domain-containing protein 62-like [Melia azedarach]|uniref:Zinc finger CCCH domain-containing protein 62-like n=1 Tax=Melia azedarach TaxID=155640 RepID=A0ACC1XVI9_MELAZ|nr:zinc finger CCCH domain-containing protein 62-like [Melia azedarach]